jgi:hypothetical protein
VRILPVDGTTLVLSLVTDFLASYIYIPGTVVFLGYGTGRQNRLNAWIYVHPSTH